MGDDNIQKMLLVISCVCVCVCSGVRMFELFVICSLFYFGVCYSQILLVLALIYCVLVHFNGYNITHSIHMSKLLIFGLYTH